MNNIILDSATATAVVTMVKNQIKNETGAKGKYTLYVEANNVTPENVGEHVKALREQAYPGQKASDKLPKNFADKVRLGLRTAIGDSPKDRNKSDKYVTAEGLKAESWETFVVKARAEWDAANNK